VKDSKTAEIKRVLMGRAVIGEDGLLSAVPAGTFLPTPLGIGDGAVGVSIFGMSRRIRHYETKDGKTRVMAAAKKSMQNIGRGLNLSEQPEAVACLIRYVLTRPTVLVFTWEDGTPTLTVWTGRGLTGWISLRRAINAFEKGLPDTMTANEVNVSEEQKKSRKEKKEEKARQKDAKKAQKAAEKNKKQAQKATRQAEQQVEQPAEQQFEQEAEQQFEQEAEQQFEQQFEQEAEQNAVQQTERKARKKGKNKGHL